MNRSSFFIENKAIFGSYPSQEDITTLENNGVRIFVDLTGPNEGLTCYNVAKNSKYINFPIKDRSIPDSSQAFCKFLIKLTTDYKNLDKDGSLYIHCKGGHGRSGVVVACLLCFVFGIQPEEALELTTQYHNNRPEMRPKWRKIGSPQTLHQKSFVIKMFKPLLYYKAFKSGTTVGFSNFTLHPINTELGVFKTAEAAFQAYKDENNKEYIKELEETESPFVAKELGKGCNLKENWFKVKDMYMEQIIKYKYDQHEEFRIALLNSNLRHIRHHNIKDNYWGYGDGTGFNKLGKILMKIRNEKLLTLNFN